MITLNSNYVRCDGENDIVIGKNLTVNGNGNTIDAKGLGRIFRINQGCTVVLDNIIMVNGNAYEGGAIYSEGPLTLNSCQIYNCNASTGGAVYTSDSITIFASVFSENTAKLGGGVAVNNSNSTYSIYYSEFYANIASGNGGGLFLEGNVSGVINGSSLKYNKAENDDMTGGGAICLHSGSYANFYDCTISGNSAFFGGAILLEGDSGMETTVIIEKCFFAENRANLGFGGAICTIQNGGIPTLDILDSSFIDNLAASGGAITLDEFSRFMIKGGDFTTNLANEGAAIYSLSNATIENTNFYNNRANNRGGAVLAEGGYFNINVDVIGSTFTSNRGNAGGAIFVSGELMVEDSIFDDNKGEGSAIYMSNGELISIGNTIDKGNARIVLTDDAKIVSDVTIIVLDNKTLPVKPNQKIKLNATVCDDNGNLIRDDKFQITVDGEAIETEYNDGTQQYEADYNIENDDQKVVSMNYVTTDNLNILIGLLGFVKANITEFNIAVGQNNKVQYGENATVYVTLMGIYDEGLNETLSVIVGDVEYTVTTTNGFGSFNASVLPTGHYSAFALFEGNGHYYKSHASCIFTVLEPKVSVIIEADDVQYGESNPISIILMDAYGELFSGVVQIEIFGISKTIFVEGINTIVATNMSIGNHTVRAQFMGDEYHDSVSNSTTFEVTKSRNYYMICYDDEIPYGEDAYISVRLSGGVTGVVYATIDGVTYNATIDWGWAEIPIPNLPIGNYPDIELFYSGDSYHASRTIFANISVICGDSGFGVVDDTFEMFYGENVTAEITINENATGNISITLVTDEFIFIKNITVKEALENGFEIAKLPVGYYAYILKYSGDEIFNEKYSVVRFEVKKGPAKGNIEFGGNLVVGSQVNITLILADDVDGQITAHVDGIKYDNFTCANGTYTLTLNSLTFGNHSVIFNLANDTNYMDYGIFETFEVLKATPSIGIQFEGTTFGEDTKITITGPEDAKGHLIIVIDDKSYVYKLEKGKLVMKGQDYAGNHSVNVTLTEDDKYSETRMNSRFTIYKANSTVRAEVPSEIKVGDHAPLIVELPEHATGNITVLVDGEEYAIFNVYDEICLTGLTNGIHTVGVRYDGDINYNPSEVANYTVDVTKVDASGDMIVTGSSVIYGENATVSVVLPNDATGTVCVIVEDGIYSADLENGSGLITIPGLKPHNYENLELVYSGDDKYDSITSNVNVTVLKQYVDWFIDGKDTTIDVHGSIAVFLTYLNPENTPGSLVFEHNGKVIGNKSFEKMMEEGAKIIFNKNGIYNIKVYAEGDSEYYEFSDSVSFTVNVRNNAAVDVTVPSDIHAGEDALITVSIPNATGNVSVIVDGAEQIIPLENGAANCTIPNASVGTYSIVVKYDGDDITAPAFVITELTVPRTDAVLIVDASLTRNATDFNAGERGAFFYAVLQDAYGNPLVNKTVAIALNGPIYYVTTDREGKAGLQINLASANTYTYAMSFIGDDEYNAAPLASTKLTVIKKTTSIAASQASFKSSAKTKTVKATLKTIKNAYDGKTYLSSGKKLTLTIDGKTYTATADGNGIANFNIGSFTKKGTFNAVIKFAGDKIYEASTKTIKITIS